VQTVGNKFAFTSVAINYLWVETIAQWILSPTLSIVQRS